MKKVTLLVMTAEERKALHNLRELGVMQIEHDAKRSVSAQSSADAVAAADRVIAFLEQYANTKTPAPAVDAAAGKALVDSAQQLAEEKSALETEINSLKLKLDRLAPWGNFSRETLKELLSKGIHTVLCQGSAGDFQQAQSLENVTVKLVSEFKKSFCFVLFSTAEIPAEVLEKLPVFKLNQEDDPAEMRNALLHAEKALDENLRQLHKLSARLPEIRAARAIWHEQAVFENAADAMKEHGAISVLSGFVPLPELDKLCAEAKKEGWGLLIDDPAEEDNVPVLIKENRFTRIIGPLFDFLGIVPGYRELDVSGGILVFFTIFYAMIIGDAGYGIIFTVLAVAGAVAAKKKPALRLPMRLFLILSIATTIWGALCGSWFGLEKIPGTDRAFPALEALQNFSSDTAKQANVQLFCFILAVAQLSTGRIWKAIRERNLRSTIDNLGWMLIIWGNFFLTLRLIVFPGTFPVYMYYLYGAGLLMVMSCGVKWNSVADLFQFPFNIIGSFTDVLSYIRLFAVSLAGACIATSFNGMAFDVCKVSPWLLPAGVIVVLLGHGLNIILAFLSVLVHAVRLNTLEFSNHTGLSWSGQTFQPFKRTTVNNNKE